jgi:hypothetical protein
MAMAEKPDLNSKARIHRIQTKPEWAGGVLKAIKN